MTEVIKPPQISQFRKPQTDGEYLILPRAFQRDGKWYDLRIRQVDSFDSTIKIGEKTPFSIDALIRIQKIAAEQIFSTSSFEKDPSVTKVVYLGGVERCGYISGNKDIKEIKSNDPKRAKVYQGAQEIYQLLSPRLKGGWSKTQKELFTTPKMIEITAPIATQKPQPAVTKPTAAASTTQAKPLNIDDLQIDPTELEEKGHLDFKGIQLSNLRKYAEAPKDDNSELDKIYKVFVRLLNSKNPQDDDADLIQMREWIRLCYEKALPQYKDPYYAATQVVGFIPVSGTCIDELVKYLISTSQ